MMVLVVEGRLRKVDHGCGMIHAGLAPFVVLGSATILFQLSGFYCTPKALRAHVLRFLGQSPYCIGLFGYFVPSRTSKSRMPRSGSDFLEAPHQPRMLRPHIPGTARRSYTSRIPQNNIVIFARPPHMGASKNRAGPNMNSR